MGVANFQHLKQINLTKAINLGDRTVSPMRRLHVSPRSSCKAVEVPPREVNPQLGTPEKTLMISWGIHDIIISVPYEVPHGVFHGYPML